MAEATGVLDTVYRLIAWTGYAGLGGALALLLVVWPDGWRQRRLALVALAGTALLALVTLGWVLAGVLGDGLPRVEGTAAIARLAVLAAVGGFFTDLLDGPVQGRRRTAAWLALLALTATLLAGAAGGRPGSAAAALTGDLLVAAAALVVGACTCLVAVVLPGDAARAVPALRARTAQVARTAVGGVAIVAAVHAVAAERSPWGVERADLVSVLLALAATAAAVLVARRVLSAADGTGAADGTSAADGSSAVPVPAPVRVPGPPQEREPAREIVAQTVAPVAPTVAQTAQGPVEGWFEPVAVPRRPAVGVYEGPRAGIADRATPDPGRTDPGTTEAVVVLPDTVAAGSAARPAETVRQVRRQPVGRPQRGRLVAGLGHVALPEAADTQPATRSVHLAGTAEPVVVELPDRD